VTIGEGGDAARHDARPGTKLIRDLLAARIPDAALSFVSSTDEHRTRLADKTREEVDEIVSSSFVDTAEYADALESLMALARISGVAWDEVERVRIRKREERGGFDLGLVYDPTLDHTRSDTPQQPV
jgi:predicted house-cleaning noncanonical NTP pyrophosphatase (MazG superfamily)